MPRPAKFPNVGLGWLSVKKKKKKQLGGDTQEAAGETREGKVTLS